MLKFIEESDFLKVDTFKENEDGSVSWVWDEGENLPTHSGIIREGFTRETQVQTGTEQVQTGTEQVQVGTETIVIGTEPLLDENGEPLLDEETGEPLTEDITEEQPVFEEQPVYEEQPVFETQVINVWDRLHELHNDPESSVIILPMDIEPIRESAKQTINSKRDNLINGGIEHNGHTYQTDPNSIMNMMGAIMTGTDVTWLTADNTQVPMTSTELTALGQAIALHKETLVYLARTYKDHIDTLNSKEDIDNYLDGLTWE